MESAAGGLESFMEATRIMVASGSPGAGTSIMTVREPSTRSGGSARITRSGLATTGVPLVAQPEVAPESTPSASTQAHAVAHPARRTRLNIVVIMVFPMDWLQMRSVKDAVDRCHRSSALTT